MLNAEWLGVFIHHSALHFRRSRRKVTGFRQCGFHVGFLSYTASHAAAGCTALRSVLFVAGGAMLALVGPSFFWKAGFISQWPGSVTHVELQNASMRLVFIEATPHIVANNELYVRRNHESELKAACLPSLSLKYALNPDRARIWRGGFPLWLLSALCLAWPVTSFIVHRRRRRRGFAVEAKAAEPAPAP